ncbi:hypothetical protein C8Q78DRAFT_932730, partial [Trametes maxima]
EVKVYDIFNMAQTATISLRNASSVSQALVSHGYLGATPIRPSVAISLRTLEMMRCVRLVKPSFSIEAFTKLICYYYHIPYRRSLRNTLSNVFDIYLAILRAIDKKVTVALGRDTPDWRVRNACPACCYKLVGEPEQTFSRMYCMDGNNSLKRMRPLGGRKVGDTHVFEESDYYISKADVDKFANEVKSTQLPPRRPPEDSSSGAQEPEGDPTDGATGVDSSCTKNWKAAQSDDKKRSWDVFEETGIFASACRHGLILWIIDMVRSGELARYPLATVSKVLDTIGERTLGGYDIGCSFQSTVRNSSLGERFTELRSRLCVNAFHGYSHNYACQVKNHPNCIEDMGIEDLETMERIFSLSNQLASVTRYASAYNRRVFIDLYFQQWDADKYLNLGKMLYDNYRQALSIIKDLEISVAHSMASLNITSADLERFMKEERAWLDNAGKESPEDLHEVAYVEALQELRSVSTELAKTNRKFLAQPSAPRDITFDEPHTGPTDYDTEMSRTRKIETNRKYLIERVKTLTMQVADFEVHLGIKNTWRPSDPQYIRVQRYIATRTYQQALVKLQGLVVQRMFELHKMNLSQTGYRMRRHIAKNLQTRSRAIRNAIAAYNAAAAALDPPRPKLEWSEISHYQFLQEFELLSDTRSDIREKPWAQPAVRETINLARRLARAREELPRVHIEAWRLHTSIRDEDRLFTVVLHRLCAAQDPSYGAVLECITRRRLVNAHILVALKKLYAIPEFSGN